MNISLLKSVNAIGIFDADFDICAHIIVVGIWLWHVAWQRSFSSTGMLCFCSCYFSFLCLRYL